MSSLHPFQALKPKCYDRYMKKGEDSARGTGGWGHLQGRQLDLMPYPLWRQEVALGAKLCLALDGSLRFS